MNSAAAVSPGRYVSARTEDRVTIAELAGELDIASAPDLREQLLVLLRPGSGRLVIDLSRVTFCDASGLAVLVGTGRRARLLSGFVRLAAVPPQVSRILRITGLDRHFPVYPTVSAAVSVPGAPSSRTGAAVQAARPAGSGRLCPSRPPGRAESWETPLSSVTRSPPWSPRSRRGMTLIPNGGSPRPCMRWPAPVRAPTL